MPALNFQKQFVPMVENGVAQMEGRVLPYPDRGVKRQTIRAERKRPFKVDDDLMLCYGMRTKQCRKLGDAVCECARRIWIDRDLIDVEGVELDVADLNDLAVADGFSSAVDMLKWFDDTHGLPFLGQLIEW